MITIKPLLLILLSVSLLTACNRQGPMGPEGPQGPDGKDGAGGSSGGGVSIYFAGGGNKIKWDYSDGWSGYGVMSLTVDESGLVPLPSAAAAQVDGGGLVQVSLLINNEWHSLPFKEEFNNGDGTYDYYVNYEIVNGALRMEAKIRDEIEVELPDVKSIKVVVAPASKTIPLTL